MDHPIVRTALATIAALFIANKIAPTLVYGA